MFQRLIHICIIFDITQDLMCLDWSWEIDRACVLYVHTSWDVWCQTAHSQRFLCQIWSVLHEFIWTGRWGIDMANVWSLLMYRCKTDFPSAAHSLLLCSFFNVLASFGISLLIDLVFTLTCPLMCSWLMVRGRVCPSWLFEHD